MFFISNQNFIHLFKVKRCRIPHLFTQTFQNTMFAINNINNSLEFYSRCETVFHLTGRRKTELYQVYLT